MPPAEAVVPVQLPRSTRGHTPPHARPGGWQRAGEAATRAKALPWGSCSETRRPERWQHFAPETVKMLHIEVSSHWPRLRWWAHARLVPKRIHRPGPAWEPRQIGPMPVWTWACEAAAPGAAPAPASAPTPPAAALAPAPCAPLETQGRIPAGCEWPPPTVSGSASCGSPHPSQHAAPPGYPASCSQPGSGSPAASGLATARYWHQRQARIPAPPATPWERQYSPRQAPRDARSAVKECLPSLALQCDEWPGGHPSSTSATGAGSPGCLGSRDSLPWACPAPRSRHSPPHPP
mmetsp:Transcript_27328/g.70938  ORF Transcript_27328/g.70938 Transcript_27328/m.70938 type:complete len:292 (-) Transcript_27328:578-1453(-)